MEDYTSNSRKSKERGQRSQAREKLSPVVSGEILERPPGVGKKFRSTFFGGDAQNAAHYVAVDVLLPALRNLIVDMVVNGMESLIYGQSRGRSRSGMGYNYGARYQLGSQGPVREAMTIGSRAYPSDPRTSRGRLNRHEINDIIIPTREEADLVLERMVDVLDKYEVVSLADYYELLGLETSHVDNKWGWFHLGGSAVRQTRQGYLIELPPLEEI